MRLLVAIIFLSTCIGLAALFLSVFYLEVVGCFPY